MRTLDADLIVVGSGFGGSVAALRAAEAGLRVIVLEQGRRLTPADLEQGAKRTTRLIWEPAAGLRGYFRQTVLRDVVIVSGVGVGGGSIVYAAVLLEPRDESFTADGWRAAGVDWADDLRPHFATAAAMLGRSVNPRRTIQDDWLEAAAREMGAAHTFGPTPQGIDFDRCISCAQCITGCPHGAKRSLDLTYLKQAEELGADIRPRSRAEILKPLSPDGSLGWRVVTTDPLARTKKASSLTARNVVLAGGVLGTNELLLAARDRWETMPALSPALGHHVRTNSEAFAAVVHPPGTDISDGATISSHFYPDDATHITNNRFPRSYSFMRWYLGPSVDDQDPAARRRGALRQLIRSPLAATSGMRARDWHRRTTVMTVMQDTDNALSLTYRRGLLGWRLNSATAPGSRRSPAYLPQADRAGRATADVSGGTAFTTLMDSMLGMSATAHILGGAVIASDPAQGVIDSDHRVFGYQGLRVLDGSAIPANVGVNPSLTITALAERAMARWLGSP